MAEARQLTIELDGATVVFRLKCANHYEAIAVYDGAAAELAEEGELHISVSGATPAEVGQDPSR